MSGMRTPEETLRLYEERIGGGFENVRDLIDEHAVFWFTSGTFKGIETIKEAFERTAAKLKSEKYWLSDKQWVASNVCTYRFNWTATVDGKPVQGEGRGTTVLKEIDDKWKITHEHLSKFPTVG